MSDYQTVEEKAVEWSITPHHVQYLCRNGKIEGAIKRAGAWFIPKDAPVPVKNTKSGVKGFNFVGTRKAILESAIDLFMIRGYNDVSLRDIAERAGIRQSTIYNHFKSKQEILDTIYDFFCYYHVKDRPKLEEMEHALHSESVFEVLEHISYDFKDDYKQKLADITRIIFQRLSIDERAREITKSFIIDEGIKYVESVFDKSVELGRFSSFDTHTMAVFVNSVRLFTLLVWIIDPSLETNAKVRDDEMNLYKYASEYLSATLRVPPK